tara:strand:+ start:273 stop:536 length:264 start_codon:yes stop_codon:yes gene_type:complete
MSKRDQFKHNLKKAKRQRLWEENEQRLIIINEKHKIVNGLHCIVEEHHISVYNEEEYIEEKRRKRWDKFMDTLKQMARGASYAINKH